MEKSVQAFFLGKQIEAVHKPQDTSHLAPRFASVRKMTKSQKNKNGN